MDFLKKNKKYIIPGVLTITIGGAILYLTKKIQPKAENSGKTPPKTEEKPKSEPNPTPQTPDPRLQVSEEGLRELLALAALVRIKHEGLLLNVETVVEINRSAIKAAINELIPLRQKLKADRLNSLDDVEKYQQLWTQYIQDQAHIRKKYLDSLLLELRISQVVWDKSEDYHEFHPLMEAYRLEYPKLVLSYVKPTLVPFEKLKEILADLPKLVQEDEVNIQKLLGHNNQDSDISHFRKLRAADFCCKKTGFSSDDIEYSKNYFADNNEEDPDDEVKELYEKFEEACGIQASYE